MPEQVIITINGREHEDLERDLVEMVVDTNVYMPAMFIITLNDVMDPTSGKLRYTDSDVFEVGAEVKIEVRSDEIPNESREVRATLIVGEVTAIEPVFAAEGVELRVRGYDRAHRLNRGKHTRTYGDANPQGGGISEKQIIETIVRETEGITGVKVEAGWLDRVKYSYVMQYNQSDWEFLWARARRLGYQLYVEDKTLYVRDAGAHRGKAGERPAKLVWGENLRSFEPRLTAVRQVDQALVKGWNPAEKQPVEGVAQDAGEGTVPKIGLTASSKPHALVQKAFGKGAEEVVVGRPVRNLDRAKEMAAARFSEVESKFVRANGACRQGDPRLIAGRLVTVEGVGEKFSGDYYVTGARHVYSQGTYRVMFGVSGRSPNTLGAILRGDEERGRGIQGVVTAKVVSLDDPEGLGRVQVLFPWLPKDKDAELASNWARIAAPMAGAERGFLFLPEVDDEVLVAFEHGDVGHPYIVGALWNKKDKPPTGTTEVLSSDKKYVNQRVLRSRSGHLIVLDDTEGEEQIIIQDKTGKNSIVINSKENSMQIRVDGDLTIEAGGKLVIKSGGDMSLESDAKGSIKTKSDLAVEATGNSKIAGAQLALEGKGKSELKGAQVSINGSGQVEVKSSGMMQIQGSLVKIN